MKGSGVSRPVISFGEILMDLIVADSAPSLEEVGLLAVRPGGAPANAAVALRRLGLPASFCGVVGDDPFGHRLRKTLRSQDVDVHALRTDPEANTTLAFAWKDARGDGHFRLLRDADILLNDVDVDNAGIRSSAAIIVGSVSLAMEPARSAIYRAVGIAREAGVPIVFDVNMRPSIWPDESAARLACQPILEEATLLKVSLDDAAVLLGDGSDPGHVASALQKYPAKFIVLTDGARGAWYPQFPGCNALVHVPAFPVEVVDPTGAGDAFTAAVLGQLIEKEWTGLDDSDLRFAAAAGALTTTRHGGIDALPARADVAQFLAAQT